MSTHEEHDKQTEINIKQIVSDHGWFLAQFEADTAIPSFSYTIGLWKNFNHPEIISFGLPLDKLNSTISIAVDIIKTGHAIILDENNYDILNNLPVCFKKVNQSNFSDYFGYAQWFYNYDKFPAIQLFWSDKNGKFTWENDFDQDLEFTQPQLDRILDFKFFEKRNEAAFSVRQVFIEGQPILYVIHEQEDGSWQFLTNGPRTQKDTMLVALEQVTKLDPTINDLFNLPRGYYATRKFIGDKWERYDWREPD